MATARRRSEGTSALPRDVRRRLGRLRRGIRSLGHGRVSPARRIGQLPGQRRRSAEPVVALTFDDGPDAGVTPALLEALATAEAPATFFMCGRNARRHPGIVREVAAAGHVIGGHTWDHRPLRDLGEAEWREQVDRTHELLEDLTGEPVRFVRPPYGAIDHAVHRRLVAAGLTPVGGSAVGRDWIETDPQVIASRVTAGVEAGAILVLHDACGDLLRPGGQLPPGTHDDRSATVAAVPLTLRILHDAGLRPVRLPSQPVSR